MSTTATTYVTRSMESYELPADTPDAFTLSLCGHCALALAGHTSADTGDPATDEAAEWMEDQWGLPYATELTGTPPAPHSTSACDGCGRSTAGSRHEAIARRVA